ncbi:hypothetical protein ZOSMA_215G00100 [Zostera marina]|uniref:Tumor susceptibility gene 101 protein n=1 Tax=Zostera marina TaxID=29655 RepID=A0A0K9PK70_ZOSMR|nr:hypothetical protein ZOSMA_215G00100 [Zostera marina]
MVPPPLMSTNSSGYSMSQFLSNALSQRGPDALPYAEETKWLIRQNLLTLAEAFPSLIPKTSHFTHNDGRTVNLLQAEGTIPMFYTGVVYNIPATLWLTESYPRQPPSVFLTPTRTMVVKPDHPYVDRSGHVSVPYLRSWIYPSSNLVDLVKTLSQLFGQDPPLYSRQSPPSTSSPDPNRSSSVSHPVPRPPSMSSSSGASGYTPPPYGDRFQQRHRPMEDPAEVIRRNSINRLVENVNGDLFEARKKVKGEMDALFGVQAELKTRGETLNCGIGEMHREIEGLEQQLQLVMMNADVLESWVKENSCKMKISDVDKVDGMFETHDGLSRQLLEQTSADLAVEDTVYALDRALQDGAIPFDKYVKTIRTLSREQFFCRATIAKVNAAQLQSRVANMAGRLRNPASYPI